jgi:GNAT superfamily N-acetyltransferase
MSRDERRGPMIKRSRQVKAKSGSVRSVTTIKIANSEAEVDRCFPVMKQLRDALTKDEFKKRVAVQRPERYRLAFLEHEGRVVAVAGFRMMNMLSSGKTLYVDDLVTDANRRSQGFGEAMIKWLTDFARSSGCRILSLDSGVQRRRAHRFYFRHGMPITDVHFELPIE